MNATYFDYKSPLKTQRLFTFLNGVFCVVFSCVSAANAQTAESGLPHFSLQQTSTGNRKVSSGETHRRDLAAERVKLASEIAGLEQSLKQESDPLKHTYIGHLRYLDSVFAQQMSLQEQADLAPSLNAALEEQKRRVELLGVSALNLQTFLDLEERRNELADFQEMIEQHQQEAAAFASMRSVIVDQRSDNERQRRSLLEKFEQESDPAAKMILGGQLDLLKLRSRIGEELILLRSKQREAADTAKEILVAKTGFLSGILDVASTDIPFTQADLQKLDTRWKQTELLLHQQIATQQQRLDLTERRISELDKEAAIDGREAQNVTLRKTLGRIRQNLGHCISVSNDTISHSLLLEQAWKNRFRVANRMLDSDQLRRADHEATQFSEMLRNEQAIAQANQSTIAQRFSAINDTNETSETSFERLESQLRADWIAIARIRSGLLQDGVRVHSRLRDEIGRQIDGDTTVEYGAIARSFVERYWAHELFAVDDKPITIGKLVEAILLMILGLLIARFVSRFVGNRLLPRFNVHHGATLAFQTTSFYVIFLLFGLITLEVLNIPLTVLTFFGGAAAIAVGFGAQNILNNFMSGLIILGERPIRVGDLIEVDGIYGTVEHIGARSTRLRTGNNHELIIPNSKFLEQPITNLTLSSFELRTSVTIGVGYDSDPEQVEKLISDCVARETSVLRTPEPIVLFANFGDNSLDFEVHFWIRTKTVMERRVAESNVRHNIKQAFKANGICIAYPQRDLHVDFKAPLELMLPAPTSNPVKHQPDLHSTPSPSAKNRAA